MDRLARGLPDRQADAETLGSRESVGNHSGPNNGIVRVQAAKFNVAEVATVEGDVQVVSVFHF